jgi:ribosomal protein S18 acetylase RimI-like enzyme
MTTSIRPAIAADEPFLAWVILAASRSHLVRGVWDHFLAAPEPEVLRFVAQMVRQPEPSFCRWEGFLVAEIDGVPAAALCGYAPDEPGRANPDPAIAAAARATFGWDGPALERADARLGPFVTCVSSVPPETWAVEWVATRPEFRRRGLVYDLLSAVMDAGRRRGLRRSQIMVLIGNTAAQCAYERAGYVVTAEKRHADFERLMGCPGIACLTRDL